MRPPAESADSSSSEPSSEEGGGGDRFRGIGVSSLLTSPRPPSLTLRLCDHVRPEAQHRVEDGPRELRELCRVRLHERLTGGGERVGAACLFVFPLPSPHSDGLRDLVEAHLVQQRKEPPEHLAHDGAQGGQALG